MASAFTTLNPGVQNPIITGKDNQYIKRTTSLQQKKYRTKLGLFLIEGLRNAAEAVKSQVCIAYALVDADKAANPAIVALVGELQAKATKVFFVESKLFQGLGVTEESQGVLLVAQTIAYSLQEFAGLLQGKNLAILDGIQDPGNIGTILRTAWAAGLGGVILVNQSGDFYNPKVVRATMGAIYNLPILTMENKNTWEFLCKEGYRLLGADLKGVPFDQFRLPREEKAAWVLGSEGAGLSHFWQEKCSHKICIPMAAGVESLNVAVAAGILFFTKLKDDK